MNFVGSLFKHELRNPLHLSTGSNNLRLVAAALKVKNFSHYAALKMFWIAKFFGMLQAGEILLITAH